MKYRFYAEFLQNTGSFAVVAWIIQIFIKRKWNHIEFVAVPDDPNFPILYYGAVSPRFRQTTLPEIRKKYRVMKRIELFRQPGFENKTDLDILKTAHSFIGTKYAYDQNLVLMFMACIEWLKRALARAKINEEKEMNCTEAFARIASMGFGYVFRTSFDMTEFEDIIKSLEV